jgi:riboflavin synthase
MFTGIVESVGTVKSIEKREESALVEVFVEIPLSDIKIGDSVAVNGVCLTVTSRLGNTFWGDISFETLKVTTLGSLKNGDKVNVERALQMGGRLGGHLVQGHVDGVGKIVKIQDVADGKAFAVQIPGNLSKYIVDKGSIAVNGVSLTVAKCEGDIFTIQMIPHTLANTTFGTIQVGETINLEVDIIGKYVEKLSFIDSNDYHQPSIITEEFLKRHGF